MVDGDQRVPARPGPRAPLAGRGDPETVAEIVAATLSEHRTLCELVSVVAAVLEHNLSVERIVRFQSRVAALSIRITNALHAALPDLPHGHTPSLLRWVHAMMAGLYPMAHPSPAAAQALRHEELEPMRADYRRDLGDALATMLRGLCRSEG